jgi:ATP-dependent helicase/nuclease subunit A
MSEALPDAAARSAIRGELERSFVVEAAAGTGKTSELVGRLVAVVLSGRGALSSIAAVTFTEKAAGEMKLRIRTELDRALFDTAQPPEARARAQAALSELETARVGTIHAFCADLLRDHPVEASVDPGYEVADAERARNLLERAFERWFERVLADPPEGVRRVLARRQVDARKLAPRLQLLAAANRLAETRDFPAFYRRDPFDRARAIEAVHAELQALALLESQGRQRDPLREALAALARQLAAAQSFELDAFEEFLRQLARDRDVWKERVGKAELYGDDLARSDVIKTRERVKQQLVACVRACEADLAACLSRELAEVVREYEREKAAAGLLDFFDLLLLTHTLLRDSAPIRHALQRSLTHVFVDEFQDTDPVQSAIILLLCADDPAEREALRARPVPGKLFVVGDPKQSIYRFRRADIALYERVKRQLLDAGAELLQLSTSFRSLPGIQACVNAAFAPVMRGELSVGQAAYVPLSAVRKEYPGQPSLIALPAPQPYGYSGRITKRAIDASLPNAVAAFIAWLVQRSGYRVSEHGVDVPVEARHVCLLFRRFRNYDGDTTRDYVRALEARRLPHVLSGGRSFHTREEVIAIRSALTAIEWPDDRLHVYATLRGPFAALRDETLFAFKTRVGHLHPLGPVDPSTLTAAEAEVHEVLQLLARLHAGRNRRPIAETLSSFLDALRAHAGLAIWPTGEQALGNVLRILDFAHVYERRRDSSSFRGFVEWLDRQAENAETPEAAVIEESSEGVRIMTVHAAKGLEFPVVVLCDPTAPKRPEYASRHIDPERCLWAQSLCDAEPVELAEQREQVREHDAAEIVRLSYVATTRARDLLVVPTCADAVIDGWLEVLTPALYPSLEQRRRPAQPSLRVPEFGLDGVLDRSDHIPPDSVAPGEHQVAGQRVVWWDPNVLDLERPSAGGAAQDDLLRADATAQRDEAGLADYRAFNEARARILQSSATPTLRSRAITTAAGSGEELQADSSAFAAPTASGSAFAAPIGSVIDTQAERQPRPGGARFGTLVHGILAALDFGVPQPDLAGLARTLGRQLSASEAEIAGAQTLLRSALAHAFFERVRAAATRGELWREAPVTMRSADGELLDGVVDLLFREDERFVVVDFKTDATLGNLSAYTRQLGLYAAALERALSARVESVLLRV